MQTRGRYSKHLRKANGSTARVCVCLSLSMPVAAQRLPLCFQACWIHFLKQCPNTIHASIHPSSFSRQPTDSGPTSHLWAEKKGQNASWGDTWSNRTIHLCEWFYMHACTSLCASNRYHMTVDIWGLLTPWFSWSVHCDLYGSMVSGHLRRVGEYCDCQSEALPCKTQKVS